MMPRSVTTAFMGALIFLAGCCGCASGQRSVVRPVKAVVRTPASSSPQLASLLDEHCTFCHTGSGEGRQLTAAILQADRPLALHAALKVSSFQMPRPPHALTSTERTDMLRALCDAGSDHPNVCLEALGYSDGRMRILGSRAYLQIVDEIAPSRPSGPALTPADALFLPLPSYPEAMFHMHDHDPLTADIFRVDPTVQVLRTLIAVDRCPPPNGGAMTTPAKTGTEKTAQKPSDFESCARAILHDETFRFPESTAGAAKAAR